MMTWARSLVTIRRALRRRKGAAMVEYALLAALIAVIAIASVTTFGTSVKGKFNTVATSV